MNVTQLHTLTTALKDAQHELCLVNRQLDHSVDTGLSAGEVVTVWETNLNDHNLKTLSSTLNTLIETGKFLVDGGLFNIEDTWFEVEDVFNGKYIFSNKLSIKADKLFSEEDTSIKRKILLDNKNKLVTMCADLEKQIKEIVNV